MSKRNEYITPSVISANTVHEDVVAAIAVGATIAAVGIKAVKKGIAGDESPIRPGRDDINPKSGN